MQQVVEPNVSFAFQFEKEFDYDSARADMLGWRHHSLYYSFVYAVLVYLGRQYMADKPAFHLRTPLMIWSGCLAIFSIAGSIRMLPRLIYLVANYGLHATVCNVGFLRYLPTGVWSYAFAVSKLYELGDTAFIVLRKQKLTFLHWYHHITVFIYCWYSYTVPGGSSSGLVFCVMNYLVHSLMYSYYTLKAMKVPVPRQVSIAITVCQLTQMMVGVSVTLIISNYKRNGVPCTESNELLYWAAAMYASYLVLFANFFYKTYICKPSAKSKGEFSSPSHSNGVVRSKND